MSQVDNKLLNFLAIRAKSVFNDVLGSNLRFLENMVKECDNVTKDLKYYLKQVEKSHNSHIIKELVSCRDGVSHLDLSHDIIDTLINDLPTGDIIELGQ